MSKVDLSTMTEPNLTCQECGMLLKDAGEYHPYAFCMWKKAGLDPWQAAATVVHALTGATIKPYVTLGELDEARRSADEEPA